MKQRLIVADAPFGTGQWEPYVDGDSIRRYTTPALRWIDISADGINYKSADTYRAPKVLIRQAGIGVNAILDLDQSMYCPQSIYIYRIKAAHRVAGIDESVLISLLCSRLFHLQVFMGFGEIDSSRAFAKLTHTRLAHLRTFSPDALRQRGDLTERLKQSVTRILSGTGEGGQPDWDIEAAWSLLFGVDEADITTIIRNFASVHANETILSLFPGGIEGREAEWKGIWQAAIARIQGGRNRS